jgi:chromosome partitioning protein
VLMAGEASRMGLPTLFIDSDPERNASNKFGIPSAATGLGEVYDAAGAVDGSELDIDKGAERMLTEVVDTYWDDVDLVPAGQSLGPISQSSMSDSWVLRDVLEKSGLADAYSMIFIDTGGRTGSLSAQAMYAADVAYAPIGPTRDAVRKAVEARHRVERIQRAHPLKWAGVVLSAFDVRVGMDAAIRDAALEEFGDEVRAILPRRATVHEAFQLGERLGDRRDPASTDLASIIRDFALFLRETGSAAQSARGAEGVA